MLNIVIFGPPGCGKGTQSARLTKKYNLVHLSTGDVIRKEIKSGSDFGLQLSSIVEKGELVPYELIIKILESALAQNRSSSGFIFDGFPRTIDQAIDLDKILAKDNQAISMVVSLCIHDEKVVERLLNRAKIEGRKDDTEDVIKNRLRVYKEQTCPLIDFYRKQGKYVEVDGDCGIDDIFCQISKIVDSKEVA
ncbi:MAG: adenylate kinase [Bacteroidetes bacterium]|nr:adenylate kinase [Bacteroidota bacterium]